MENISYEDFKKLDMRLGRILDAEAIAETDKLIKCKVSFGQIGSGEEEVRTIVSGIREYFTPEEIIGKQVLYVLNLEPRMIRGVESRGMLMAVNGINGQVEFLVADGNVKDGANVR